MNVRRCAAVLLAFAATTACLFARSPRKASLDAPQSAPTAAFLKAADEVLADMSKLLSLPIRQPLKRSVRTKAEIRTYLIRNMHEEQDGKKLHADVRAMEMLGLLPKSYPLEQTLIDLLTQQIAGVYDSKGREFFISAATEPGEQRVVMAHELTHALEDQSFHIERWSKEAKGNDDAEFARNAVLEGSAMAAMINYVLRANGGSFADLANVDPALLLGDVDSSPDLNGVPLVIKDQLLFPYLNGSAFSVKVLQAHGGWTGLHTIFEKPPASTQQIMHPDLYLRGARPDIVAMPSLDGVVPKGWKKLDENVMGEFGINQVLKQFLGKRTADELAAYWTGDRYAVFEESPQGSAMLMLRLQLAGNEEATRFFDGYSELLNRRFPDYNSIVRRDHSIFVMMPDGNAFIRCVRRECVLGDGLTPAQYDSLGRALGWPVEPPPSLPAPRMSALAELRVSPRPLTETFSQFAAPR
jgi:hypothetical protein